MYNVLVLVCPLYGKTMLSVILIELHMYHPYGIGN